MPIPSPRVTELVNKDGKQPRQVRISRKVRDAVALMVYQGMKRDEAAEEVGLKPQSLYVAFRKNEVRALLNEMLADLRQSAAARSIARVDRLADTAESEHVRLQANTFLLGIEGVRPSERHVHDHTVRIVPGYVLDPGGPDLRRPAHLQDTGPVIDGEGREIEQDKRSPQSVQHDDSADDARPQDIEGG